MEKHFYYPHNLSEKSTLFMWQIKDIVVLAILLIISVLIAILSSNIYPLLCPMIFAFLTIRVDNSSLFSYIKRIIKFFVSKQEFHL